MRNNADADLLRTQLEPVLSGLGYNLIETTVSKQKGSVQIRAVIFKKQYIGIDDCSKVHKTILPRLELAFSPQDVYLEVSSPGIDRLIKNCSEYKYFTGIGLRCYCTDISDWRTGILEAVTEKDITLKINGRITTINFDVIAKAKLDNSSQEVKIGD
jgi:ribosome maturation factor RimP